MQLSSGVGAIGPARSKTRAITIALRERLIRIQNTRSAQSRLKEMRAIAKRCARLIEPGPASTEHGDLLYDERGLPN